MSTQHTYQARCSWSGSTGEGYQHYRREHTGAAPPARDSLVLSAGQAFLGRADHLNPEQLVVLAAASCQLLSFLAVAARARLEVMAYDDEAEGVMPADDYPVRLSRIVLRPRIMVAPGVLRRQLAAHRDRGRGGGQLRRPLMHKPILLRALNHPGFDGGSVYWFPTRVWSACGAA